MIDSEQHNINNGFTVIFSEAWQEKKDLQWFQNGNTNIYKYDDMVTSNDKYCLYNIWLGIIISERYSQMFNVNIMDKEYCKISDKHWKMRKEIVGILKTNFKSNQIKVSLRSLCTFLSLQCAFFHCSCQDNILCRNTFESYYKNISTLVTLKCTTCYYLGC